MPKRETYLRDSHGPKSALPRPLHAHEESIALDPSSRRDRTVSSCPNSNCGVRVERQCLGSNGCGQAPVTELIGLDLSKVIFEEKC